MKIKQKFYLYVGAILCIIFLCKKFDRDNTPGVSVQNYVSN